MIKININILIFKILLNKIYIIFKYQNIFKMIGIFNSIMYLIILKFLKIIILINLYYFHTYHYINFSFNNFYLRVFSTVKYILFFFIE